MYKIGIIEDNYFLRNTYKEYLDSFKDFQVVFALESAEDFEKGIKTKVLNKADLVLIDIELPGLSGLDTIQIVKRQMPNAKVMMLSNFEEQRIVIKAIQNGADGYIIKSSLLMELSKSITDILSNGAYLSPLAAKKVIDHFTTDSSSELVSKLTKRERELLAFVKRGSSYREIAEALFVTQATVNYHMNNIFKKVQVKNKSELMSLLYAQSKVN